MVGMQTNLHAQGDKLIVENVQDCTPIAEYAKARQREGHHGSSEMRLAASLPLVMVEKYCNDNKISFAEWSADKSHIKRMLNDPALAHFRVWPGRV
jgi:hypothetical protein